MSRDHNLSFKENSPWSQDPRGHVCLRSGFGNFSGHCPIEFAVKTEMYIYVHCPIW